MSADPSPGPTGTAGEPSEITERERLTRGAVWDIIGDRLPGDVPVRLSGALDDYREAVRAAAAGAAPADGPQYRNNVVACVACKRPVTVTALNAIRCERCAAPASPGDFLRKHAAGVPDFAKLHAEHTARQLDAAAPAVREAVLNIGATIKVVAPLLPAADRKALVTAWDRLKGAALAAEGERPA